jgi:hypothetical protein
MKEEGEVIDLRRSKFRVRQLKHNRKYLKIFEYVRRRRNDARFINMWSMQGGREKQCIKEMRVSTIICENFFQKWIHSVGDEQNST